MSEKRWRPGTMSPAVYAWWKDMQPRIAKAEQRAAEAKATVEREWRGRQEERDE